MDLAAEQHRECAQIDDDTADQVRDLRGVILGGQERAAHRDVRDEQCREDGADGVRMGMMLAAPAGNDILFDDALCEQGRNFNNKIWNAFRLVKGWEVADIAQPEYARLATEWF